jgi:hypothetical protein
MNFRIEYQPFNYMICLLLIKYIYFMCRSLNLVRNLLATRIATQITIILKWGRNWTPPVKSISTPSLLPFFLTPFLSHATARERWPGWRSPPLTHTTQRRPAKPPRLSPPSVTRLHLHPPRPASGVPAPRRVSAPSRCQRQLLIFFSSDRTKTRQRQRRPPTQSLVQRVAGTVLSLLLTRQVV